MTPTNPITELLAAAEGIRRRCEKERFTMDDMVYSVAFLHVQFPPLIAACRGLIEAGNMLKVAMGPNDPSRCDCEKCAAIAAWDKAAGGKE